MVMQAGLERLGNAMSFLASQYARRFNLRHNRSGHLFERRYRAILVQEDVYLKELVRYIHMNPVRAGMVDNPCEYQWSSHNTYLDPQARGLLSNKYVLDLFGTNRRRAGCNYRLFMGQPEISQTLEKLRDGGTDKRAIGNDVWLKNILREDYTPTCKKTLDDIVSVACQMHGIKEDRLAAPRGPHNYSKIRARIAIEALEAGAASISQVARRFNRSPSALSQAIKLLRCSEKLKN